MIRQHVAQIVSECHIVGDMSEANFLRIRNYDIKILDFRIRLINLKP